MSYILIPVIMVVIFILIFVAFSVDDREDGAGYLSDEAENEQNSDIGQDSGSSGAASIKEEDPTDNELENDNPVSSMFQQIAEEDEDESEEETEETSAISEKKADRPVEMATVHQITERQAPRVVASDVPLLEVGSEDDLRLRLKLKNHLAKPVSMGKADCAVAVVQLRFKDEAFHSSEEFVNVLRHAESVFDKEFTFDFNSYQSSQFNRIWVFEPDKTRDVIVESLITAYEANIRFRKALENDKVLNDAKVRIAIGLSVGEVGLVQRGVNSEPSIIGKTAYIAEAIAEIAGDFSIYVDNSIFNATLPLFDFREWKPIMVRQTMSPIPFYELVGWSKPDEIASFVKHESMSARRAVAIAFRYFEIDEFNPLLELLSDSETAVVLEAIKTISYIGNDRMNGALKMRLPEVKDGEIKSRIIEAFGNAGNSSVMPVVLASTKDSSWKVRLAATKALYQLSGGNAISHLQEMLNDPDGAVRVAANNVFYKETKETRYFDALVEFLGDASKRTRCSAVDVLLEIDTDKALKEITNAFGNQELDLQKHILSKMADSKSKILYQCYLTMFKNSGEALRAYIIEAVRRAGIVS